MVKECIKQYFELHEPYRFDPADITATIYVICTAMKAIGADCSLLMLTGAMIGALTCWKARRVNLVVLNVTLLIFNVLCIV